MRKLEIEYANKNCRKLKLGEVSWSKILQVARDSISLWQRVLSRVNNIRISTRLISQLEKKAEVKNSLYFNKAQILIKLKESFTRYYLLKKNAVSLREC